MSPRAAFRRCIAQPCPRPAMPGRGLCEAHTRIASHAVDKRRGSAARRGYGARWSAYRARFLVLYPRCGDRPASAPPTRDSLCAARGLDLMSAEVVDHIVPIRGKADPRFFDESNHQSLCTTCHNAKRQREARVALAPPDAWQTFAKGSGG